MFPDNKRLSLFLISVYLVVYILPLAARPLFVPDETRYGEIPREMISSGDWVVPHLNGLSYFEKPVMGYWLHAISILIFGENRFALRLPSVLAVGLAAVLLFLMVKNTALRDKQDTTSAFLVVLVFLTCFEVAGVGTFTVLDSLLALFLTSTMIFFFLATESPPGSAREKICLLLTGVFCGLAFLSKGFLAFAIPVMVCLPYLVWMQRWRDIFRLAWLPIVVVLIVVLPWSVLIYQREPDFWRFFFWNEHIRRFTAANAQHKQSFLFFFATAPVMFLPWSFVAPAAIKGLRKYIRKGDARSRLFRFSLCWFILPFLFFSASNGKLLTYILPCFPPFAILLTLGLENIVNRKINKLFKAGVSVTSLLFLSLLLLLVFAQFSGFQGLYPYGQPWKFMLLAAALIFMIYFTWRSAYQSHREGKLLSLAMAPLLLFTSLNFVLPDQTIAIKAPNLFLARHRQEITPQVVIIADEEIAVSACWEFKRDNVYFMEGAGEMMYGLKKDRAMDRLLNVQDAAQLIKANHDNIVLVARENNYRRWQEGLPVPRRVETNGPEGYIWAAY